MLYHVPSGSKSPRSGFATGMSRLESAEVRQHRPGRARPDLDHAVRDRGYAVRTARSGEKSVELIADEGNARDSADEVPERGTGLARRQRIDNGRDGARR